MNKLITLASLFGAFTIALAASPSPAASVTNTAPISFPSDAQPPQCSSNCSEVLNTVNNATCEADPTCICTASVADSLRSCLQCDIDALNTTAVGVSLLQQSLDQILNACAAQGLQLPSEQLLLPNSTAAPSLNISSASASSTAPSTPAPAPSTFVPPSEASTPPSATLPPVSSISSTSSPIPSKAQGTMQLEGMMLAGVMALTGLAMLFV